MAAAKAEKAMQVLRKEYDLSTCVDVELWFRRYTSPTNAKNWTTYLNRVKVALKVWRATEWGEECPSDGLVLRRVLESFPKKDRVVSVAYVEAQKLVAATRGITIDKVIGGLEDLHCCPVYGECLPCISCSMASCSGKKCSQPEVLSGREVRKERDRKKERGRGEGEKVKRCDFCDKQGHTWAGCYSRAALDTHNCCYNCGEQGHAMGNCRVKKRMASNPPRAKIGIGKTPDPQGRSFGGSESKPRLGVGSQNSDAKVLSAFKGLRQVYVNSYSQPYNDSDDSDSSGNGIAAIVEGQDFGFGTPGRTRGVHAKWLKAVRKVSSQYTVLSRRRGSGRRV